MRSPASRLACASALALLGALTLAGGAHAQSTAIATETAPNDSGTLKRADKAMGTVLKKLQELGAQPLGSQTVEATRAAPTPADAAKAVLKDQGKNPDALLAALKVAKQDLAYPTEGGSQTVRIYTPEGEAPAGGWPLIVYYHGGGFVIADIDTYEPSALALAAKAKAVVAAVEYRHAPEAKFPAAHEDAIAAYRWLIENAGQIQANPAQVALAGESAGGNLAANVAIAARDQNLAKPLHMLLVYPVANSKMDTPSYKENEYALPLGKAGMEWFFAQAAAQPSDAQDPRIDLVNAKLEDLPPATIILAEIDPLRSDGEMLAARLKAAGVKVTTETYKGVTHEFFGMADVVPDAQKAQDLAARQLRQAFAAAAKR